jgi:RecB family exonuclease
MACPGSRAMCERYARDEETEASAEGELAHKVAALYLASSLAFRILSNAVDILVAKEMPLTYTAEMHDGAKLYKSVIERYYPDSSANGGNISNFIQIEERVNIDNVHPEMWGTPDAWGIIDETLHVFDYKFGHTPVEVFENWQLIAYACGVLKDVQKVKNIYLHIIQPRDFVSISKHKVWGLTAQELEDYKQRLIISETLAMTPNAPLKISAECKYCPARHACPALQQAAFGACEVSFRDIPQGIDPHRIGGELKLLHEARDLLDYRITALETEVTHLLQSGANVDNYELLASEGRLSWSVSNSQIIELGMLHGVNLKKDDVITPTQAIKAGISETDVLKYSKRKQSLKLSKIDLSKSKKIFGGK